MNQQQAFGDCKIDGMGNFFPLSLKQNQHRIIHRDQTEKRKRKWGNLKGGKKKHFQTNAEVAAV